MKPTTLCTLAGFLVCLSFSTGCNRSGNADVTKAQADAEAARAEVKAAKDALAKATADADAAKAELAKLKEAQTKLAQVAPQSPDREAADWVLKVDGSVKVVADGVSLLVKKGEKLPEGPFSLVEMEIGTKKASDDGTHILHGLKNLRALNIGGFGDSEITKLDFVAQMPVLEKFVGSTSDSQLLHFKGLPKLKYLDVSYFFGNPKITDAGLEHVKDMKQLEVLGLFACNITDAGLQHLKGLESLKVLNLERTRVSDAGLEHLNRLTKLEQLSLPAGKGNVSEAGVKTLQAALPKCMIVAR